MLIFQRFTGLNVWDQLAVEIQVNGNLPQIPSNAVISPPDAIENYIFEKENRIQASANGVITTRDQNISYTINQMV